MADVSSGEVSETSSKEALQKEGKLYFFCDEPPSESIIGLSEVV